MLKYANTQLGFREFPGEVALLINISGCPNKCKGCHSSYLLEDKQYSLEILEAKCLLKTK